MQSEIIAKNLFNAALEDIKNNSYNEAEIKLKQANLKLPNKQSIIQNLSSVLLKNKKYNEANTILEEAIKNFPKDADLLLNKSPL